MPLNIKDRETHEMARQLAAQRGVSLTQAVRGALEEALDRQAMLATERARAIDSIVDRASGLPVLDSRNADEILGYDERTGLPR